MEGKKPTSTTLFFFFSVVTVFFSLVFGMAGGAIGYVISSELDENESTETVNTNTTNVSIVQEESAIIDVAETANESVVSVIVSAEVPTYEIFTPFENLPGIQQRRQSGTQEQQIGSGTGFIISEDGVVVTNKHVVDVDDANYSVVFNDGRTLSVEVLARDTLLDIAFLQIEDADDLNLISLPLGSSDSLQVGQTVIAIGNALGEFSNTVSSGIISGLSREIVATDGNGQFQELLPDVIQTDASINPGNSGGPLLDIQGNVIGVNVAVASGGENIAFAIPIDLVNDLLDRFDRNGNINRPILGVRYAQITPEIAEDNDLPVDYGAIIISSRAANDAIVPGSPADEAGLQEGDIILEIDGTRVEGNNSLQRLIQEKYIGDSVTLKVLTEEGEELEFEVELFEVE